MNFDWEEAGEKHKLDLQEFEEIRLEAYDNATLYKESMKHTHNYFIKENRFENGQWVLLYQNRFRFASGKLSTKWVRPFVLYAQHPNGAVEIGDLTTNKVFKVDGGRLKLYYGKDLKFHEWDLEQDEPPDM